MKKTFLIENNFVNARLDKWFKRKVCEIPQSLIEKYIRKGKIKVNNKKKKSSYKVQENDHISVYNYNSLIKKKEKKKIVYKPNKKELTATSNIFIENNENFVVINKPAGISVQSGTKSRRNIIDLLRNTKEFENISPY